MRPNTRVGEALILSLPARGERAGERGSHPRPIPAEELCLKPRAPTRLAHEARDPTMGSLFSDLSPPQVCGGEGEES